MCPNVHSTHRKSYPLLCLMLILLGSHSLSAQHSIKPRKPRVLNIHEVLNPKVYPKALKQYPQEGIVVLDIWLNPEGEVIKHETITANNRLLQQYVESRVQRLIFSPAKNRYGTNAYGKVRLPFEFILDENVEAQKESPQSTPIEENGRSK